MALVSYFWDGNLKDLEKGLLCILEQFRKPYHTRREDVKFFAERLAPVAPMSGQAPAREDLCRVFGLQIDDPFPSINIDSRVDISRLDNSIPTELVRGPSNDDVADIQGLLDTLSVPRIGRTILSSVAWVCVNVITWAGLNITQFPKVMELPLVSLWSVFKRCYNNV